MRPSVSYSFLDMQLQISGTDRVLKILILPFIFLKWEFLALNFAFFEEKFSDKFPTAPIFDALQL